MGNLPISKNELKQKINKLSYYLLCALILAIGLYFIMQGFAAIQ